MFEARRIVEQLCIAAYDGDVDEVRRLMVARGANPSNAPDFPFGYTPLHCASQKGSLPVVEYLIAEAQVDTNKSDDTDGFTALHVACVYNHPHVARYLVETGGADVETRDNRGETPLHRASLTHILNNVRFLVEDGLADVNATNNMGRTPLDEAICLGMDADEQQRSEKENIIRYLLPRTSSVAEEALRTFWWYDYLVDVRGLLLEKYALGRGLANAFRLYPIHTLFKEFPLDSSETFRDSIKLFPSSVLSLQDEEGRLSLHVALTSENAKVKSPSVVALLFEREPRSALARDPNTGLYPHETAAGLVSSNDDTISGKCWLDCVYKIFRSNPQPLLQSRTDLERRSTDEDDQHNVVGRQTAKRQKMEHNNFH